MRADDLAFRTFLVDQLDGLAGLQIRSMFGGAGVYAEGVMFGLVAENVLYLKADDLNRTHFERAGSRPFVYAGKSKPVSLSYWQAQEHIYEDQEVMREWARLALDAAHRAKRPRRPNAKGGER
jgi:DNA transformation protein